MIRGAIVLLAWMLAIPAVAQSVTVIGLSGHARTFSGAQLIVLPRDKVVLKSRGGGEVTYEGASLTALLQAVGAPSGKSLHASDMTDVVLVSARDGYRVAFSLPETDASIRGERIILADEADGHPLAAPEGPLRLVVEGDGRPARSVRMVTSIRLLRLSASRARR